MNWVDKSTFQHFWNYSLLDEALNIKASWSLIFSEEILTKFGDIPYISLAFLELILFNRSCTSSGVVSLRKKQCSLGFLS